MVLSQVKARDIMTPGVIVEAVPKASTLREIYNSRDLIFTRIPVFGGSKASISGYILRTEMPEKTVREKWEHIRRKLQRTLT